MCSEATNASFAATAYCLTTQQDGTSNERQRPCFSIFKSTPQGIRSRPMRWNGWNERTKREPHDPFPAPSHHRPRAHQRHRRAVPRRHCGRGAYFVVGAMTQQRLIVAPCSNEAAKIYVESFHRHHGSSVQARFCIAACDEIGNVRGVAMVGRPVSRVLDNGWTLEVNRLASDGCPNVCSLLYSASRRIAREMGYRKLITYIREDEPGTSLRAAGWRFEEAIRARSWNMPGRPREDKTEIVRRGRWSVDLCKTDFDLIWPKLSAETQEKLFA